MLLDPCGRRTIGTAHILASIRQAERSPINRWIWLHTHNWLRPLKTFRRKGADRFQSRGFEAACFLPWMSIQALTALNSASPAEMSMTQRKPATKDSAITRFVAATVALE